MTPEELITDADLDAVWGNANFGTQPRRDVVQWALLKIACGFSTGHTIECILRELRLIGETRFGSSDGARLRAPLLRKRGRQYLWACFGGEYAKRNAGP